MIIGVLSLIHIWVNVNIFVASDDPLVFSNLGARHAIM
jgi:hypothetical protein